MRFFASLWLSPDDELAVISTIRIETDTTDTENLLIRTDGSAPPVPVIANVAGYVPTSVAELLES